MVKPGFSKCPFPLHLPQNLYEEEDYPSIVDFRGECMDVLL